MQNLSIFTWVGPILYIILGYAFGYAQASLKYNDQKKREEGGLCLMRECIPTNEDIFFLRTLKDRLYDDETPIRPGESYSFATELDDILERIAANRK
jgi:hypothetical protein